MNRQFIPQADLGATLQNARSPKVFNVDLGSERKEVEMYSSKGPSW